MKITWFSGTALRIYAGGEIIVVDPQSTPPEVNRQELLAGADRVVRLEDPAIPVVDPANWRPRVTRREIDMAEPSPAELIRIATRSLLIAAPGESPLVILGAGEPPRFGRWADNAVIVLAAARESLVAEVTVLLDVARPRLIALAFVAPDLDTMVAEIAEHLDGAGLASLEPGLALEV